jgi:hypothetical protein
MSCAECGGVLGINNGHLAIFAVGFSGHNSACRLCPACYQEALARGGPGPNVNAQSRVDASNAIGRRRAARGY